MSDRSEGRPNRDDSFDLDEPFVEVRKAPPGRGVGRIVAAGVAVALGLFLSMLGALFGGIVLGLAFGTPFYGLGFAIYDYRWPFGPRPGRRSSGRRQSRRESPGAEDY